MDRLKANSHSYKQASQDQTITSASSSSAILRGAGTMTTKIDDKFRLFPLFSRTALLSTPRLPSPHSHVAESGAGATTTTTSRLQTNTQPQQTLWASGPVTKQGISRTAVVATLPYPPQTRNKLEVGSPARRHSVNVLDVAGQVVDDIDPFKSVINRIAAVLKTHEHSTDNMQTLTDVIDKLTSLKHTMVPQSDNSNESKGRDKLQSALRRISEDLAQIADENKREGILNSTHREQILAGCAEEICKSLDEARKDDREMEGQVTKTRTTHHIEPEPATTSEPSTQRKIGKVIETFGEAVSGAEEIKCDRCFGSNRRNACDGIRLLHRANARKYSCSQCVHARQRCSFADIMQGEGAEKKKVERVKKRFAQKVAAEKWKRWVPSSRSLKTRDDVSTTGSVSLRFSQLGSDNEGSVEIVEIEAPNPSRKVAASKPLGLSTENPTPHRLALSSPREILTEIEIPQPIQKRQLGSLSESEDQARVGGAKRQKRAQEANLKEGDSIEKYRGMIRKGAELEAEAKVLNAEATTLKTEAEAMFHRLFPSE